MKKQVLTLVGVLSLMLAAGSAFAQSSQEVRANVPFDFVVNHQTMAAGQYAITAAGTGNEAILVRGLDKKGVRLSTTDPIQANQPSGSTKLVFRKSGDTYFLTQIWVEGNDRGRKLPLSKQDSELAKDTASQDVILYASVR